MLTNLTTKIQMSSDKFTDKTYFKFIVEISLHIHVDPSIPYLCYIWHFNYTMHITCMFGEVRKIN